MRLAKLINWIDGQPRWLTVVYGILFWLVLYTLPNQFQLWEPGEMFLFPGEKNIPFVSETIVGYLCALPFVVVGTLALPNGVYAKAYTALLVTSIIHCLFFWLGPTHFPRAYEPDSFLWLYSLLHWLDEPTNCFPSMHVSFAVLTANAWNGVNRFWFVMSWVLVIMIAICTLTTKQHYEIDVVVGGCLATFVHFLVFRE